MPTRDKAPIGSPCWIDLWTSNTDSSRSFYSQIFGWEAQEPSPEFGGYFMFTRNGVPVAGGMGDMGDMGEMRADNTWKMYLASEDAAKTAEMAEAAGGRVVGPVMTVADLGAQAVLIDPTGATVGVWEPRSFPGLTVLTEGGAASWFELHTRDYEGAIEFYRSVFHWETRSASDTADFRYTMLHDPETGTDLAGVIDASRWLGDAPSRWCIYFGVDDTDAALAKISSLGGSIVHPAEDTPYGRLASAADPSGAEFKLVAPNDAMPAR